MKTPFSILCAITYLCAAATVEAQEPDDQLIQCTQALAQAELSARVRGYLVRDLFEIVQIQDKKIRVLRRRVKRLKTKGAL